MGAQRRVENRYGLVPVTNTRDFVLVGEDAEGRPAKLETFRLAESAEEFQLRLEKPGAFAREAGAGLGEYLCRALSQRAALSEPRDLAWLLASYARDGLARVEDAASAPSLPRVFGFEIMPAPFVVARAGHSRQSRAGVQMAVCGRGFETTSRGGSGARHPTCNGAASATSALRIRRLIRFRRRASLQGQWVQADPARRWDAL